MAASPRNKSSIPYILLVEDDQDLCDLYCQLLPKELDVRVVVAPDGRTALTYAKQRNFQLALVDLGLPDIDGYAVTEHLAGMNPPCPVVVITGEDTAEAALRATRAGAFDFMVKPVTPSRLFVTVRNGLERQRMKHVIRDLAVSGRNHFEGFIGSSPAMQAVYRIIETIAASKAPVFILGESGTGKELCAEAIHRCSNRRDKPMITINCAAIPRDLMESEIFGHVRGAFTGASAERPGAAQQADGGTLFLDEIGEMDLGLQAKVLRFLQTGEARRVGEDRARQFDIRIICATNRNPLEEVKEGRFREDLFYRLHVLPLELPALRERSDDILLIAHHVMEQYAKEEKKRFKGFDKEAKAALLNHAWPGNVRELLNVIRAAIVMHEGTQITAEMLPRSVLESSSGTSGKISSLSAAKPATAVRPLLEIERETIEHAIQVFDGNLTLAAKALGINASTVYRKMRGWQNPKMREKTR